MSIFKLKAISTSGFEVLLNVNVAEHNFQTTQLGANVTKIIYGSLDSHGEIEVNSDSVIIFQ